MFYLQKDYTDSVGIDHFEKILPQLVSVFQFIIPPQTNFGGYVGIILTVCLSVRLFTLCPGHNFLNPCLIWTVIHKLLFMTKGCVMTLTQGHISKVKGTVHT